MGIPASKGWRECWLCLSNFPAGIYFLKSIMENQSIIWNLFYVNNKTTRTKSIKSFWCLYYWLWTDFTHCAGFHIVDFEQLNAGWFIQGLGSFFTVGGSWLKMSATIISPDVPIDITRRSNWHLQTFQLTSPDVPIDIIRFFSLTSDFLAESLKANKN